MQPHPRVVDTFPDWREPGPLREWASQFEPPVSGKEAAGYHVMWNCSLIDFVAIGRFLSPIFVEMDDCVFLQRDRLEQMYDEWRKKHDKRQVEAVLNHLHIGDVWHGQTDDSDVYAMAAEVIAHSWRLHLKAEFPERTFVVSVEVDDEAPGMTEVTFFQPVR